MSSFTSIEIIDYGLGVLYNSNNPYGMDDGTIYGLLVRDIRKLDGEVYTINKLKSTLKTLESDNLIYSELKVSNITKKERVVYFLSLDGELLVERGGYNERLKEIKQDKVRTNRQWWFNVGIFVSTAFAVLISIAEYFKKDEIRLLQPQVIQKVQLGKHLIIIDTSLRTRDSLINKK